MELEWSVFGFLKATKNVCIKLYNKRQKYNFYIISLIEGYTKVPKMLNTAYNLYQYFYTMTLESKI